MELGRLFSMEIPLNRDAEPEPALPLKSAQAMELRDRWERWNVPSDLKPGDLVMERPGLGSRKPHFRKNELLILWRMLDPTNPVDQMHIEQAIQRGNSGTDRQDCMVGSLEEHGICVNIYPNELRHLERWVPNIDDALPGDDLQAD